MSSYAKAFENAPEYREPIDLSIRGVIPSWLSGVLYRTGPGTTRIPATSDPTKIIDIQHWFDGLAIHHRFEIFVGGKRVSYCSRKGAEDLEKRIADTGEYPGVSFGQRGDPCRGIFRKFFTVWETMRILASPLSPSMVNISVTLTPNMPGLNTEGLGLTSSSGARYIVAKTDASALQLVDPNTLEPLLSASYQDIDPRLNGPLSAAHSCRDQETGDFYNYSLAFGGRLPTYKVFRIRGRDGSVDILAEIKDAPPAYIHSFAMTQRYIILCIWQAHIKHWGLSIPLNKNMTDSIDTSWKPHVDTVFYVVDRIKGGIVSKYKVWILDTPPFFCFHHLNSFDDPETGDIIIDMSIYPDNKIIDLLYLQHLRSSDENHHSSTVCARRFRLLSPGRPETRDAIVEFTRPQTEGIELPVVAPQVQGKVYRYAYGINSSDSRANHTLADGLIKLDMSSEAAASKVWRLPGHIPSEPIFVPRPGAVNEDDGVLLSVVLDEQGERSAMVVLDAATMTEVARAELPYVFPIGFHGVWTEWNS
ncbi:hypothetical protein NM688_g2774 [Phlebia brevispora]|uniref:Uncharacterized protein n=1 Tax=Phlebia brevispora TaxID=194682 RepID=A0ACC1T7J4_9APHY|nr:hypothetical protein NM688_g2774 [Phlebia brevispora]